MTQTADRNEYQDWLAYTKQSASQWQVDIPMLHNHQTVLAYFGGTNGVYLQSRPEGNDAYVEIGTYEGAIPWITEAAFGKFYGRTFKDTNPAQAAKIAAAKMGKLELVNAIRHTIEQVQ